jgi:hypothetical protein
MSLLIFRDTSLETNFNLNNESFITTHNGYTGGSYEFVFYLKNNDASLYYTDIVVKPVFPVEELLPGNLLSETGWSIKVSYGSDSQLTEKEWNEIQINEELQVPDIGNSESANTDSYFPINVRVYCPGKTESQIRNDLSLNLRYIQNIVIG